METGIFEEGSRPSLSLPPRAVGNSGTIHVGLNGDFLSNRHPGFRLVAVPTGVPESSVLTSALPSRRIAHSPGREQKMKIVKGGIEMRRNLVALIGFGVLVMGGSLLGVPPHRIFLLMGGGVTVFALYREWVDLAQVIALLTIAGVISFK